MCFNFLGDPAFQDKCPLSKRVMSHSFTFFFDMANPFFKRILSVIDAYHCIPRLVFSNIIIGIFTLKIGEMESDLTSIFSKCVETTN